MKGQCICHDGCVEEVTLTCSPSEALIIIKALRCAYGERWHNEDTLIAKRMLEVFDNFEWEEESDGCSD